MNIKVIFHTPSLSVTADKTILKRCFRRTQFFACCFKVLFVRRRWTSVCPRPVWTKACAWMRWTSSHAAVPPASQVRWRNVFHAWRHTSTFMLFWRHLQGFAASWKSTSASPTPAWMEVRAKTCPAATLATAPSASRATTAMSTSTSVTVPPVCTEAPASMPSTISGGPEEQLIVSVSRPAPWSRRQLLFLSLCFPQVSVCRRLPRTLMWGRHWWVRPQPLRERCELLGRTGLLCLPLPPGVQRDQVWDRYYQLSPMVKPHLLSRLAWLYTPVACFLFNISFAAPLEMSSAFNLDFEVSGIHGYVMMDGVMPSLTEITCTFWMKSSDTTNYGTPVSYAVEGSDNAFLLIDYNGSVKSMFLYFGDKIYVSLCNMNLRG